MVGGSLRVLPASSTTKTGHHDIAEILLKVALDSRNESINHRKTRANCRFIKHFFLMNVKQGKISVTGYFLARIQLYEGRFRLAKKKHTEFVLQCSISGLYLASKLQKVQEFQSEKLIYRQIFNPL